MLETTETTEIEAPMDRSKVSCLIATWKCMLDNFERDSVQHTLISDTIHTLEDYREERRI